MLVSHVAAYCNTLDGDRLDGVKLCTGGGELNCNAGTVVDLLDAAGDLKEGLSIGVEQGDVTCGVQVICLFGVSAGVDIDYGIVLCRLEVNMYSDAAFGHDVLPTGDIALVIGKGIELTCNNFAVLGIFIAHGELAAVRVSGNGQAVCLDEVGRNCLGNDAYNLANLSSCNNLVAVADGGANGTSLSVPADVFKQGDGLVGLLLDVDSDGDVIVDHVEAVEAIVIDIVLETAGVVLTVITGDENLLDGVLFLECFVQGQGNQIAGVDLDSGNSVNFVAGVIFNVGNFFIDVQGPHALAVEAGGLGTHGDGVLIAGEDDDDGDTFCGHLELEVAVIVRVKDVQSLIGLLVENLDVLSLYTEAGICRCSNDFNSVADIAAACSVAIDLVADGTLTADICCANCDCIGSEECLDFNSASGGNNDLALLVGHVGQILINLGCAANIDFESGEGVCISCQRLESDGAADSSLEGAILFNQRVVEVNLVLAAIGLDIQGNVNAGAAELTGDGNAACGHLEYVLVIAAECNEVTVCITSDGDVHGQAVASLDLIGLDVNICAGVSLGDAVAVLVVGTEDTALDSFDNDAVGVVDEGHSNGNVACGHGEGIVEDIDVLAVAIVGNNDGADFIALDSFPDDGNLGALGCLVYAGAINLNVKAAVDAVFSVEVVSLDRCQLNIDDNVLCRHQEVIVIVDGNFLLNAQQSGVVNADVLDSVAGIGADNLDRAAFGSGRNADTGDGCCSLVAVVAVDGDVIAGVDVSVNADIACGHNEGVGSELQICSAVGILDDQAVNCLLGVGGNNDSNGLAGLSGADSLVVDVELHGAVVGIDICREVIALCIVIGSVVGVGVAVIVVGIGVAVIGIGACSLDGGCYGQVEVVASLNICQVLSVVQSLEQLGVLAVVNAVLLAESVCSLTGSDLVLYDCIAGGADSRSLVGGQKQGSACVHIVPAGNTVECHDLLGVVSKADTHGVADTENGLTTLNGVRYQIVDNLVSRAGASNSHSAIGGSSGGSAIGAVALHSSHDGSGCRVRHRNLDHLADAQASEASLAGDVVKCHDGILAGIVVYTHLLADSQNVVALYQSVLLVEAFNAEFICVSAYGHATEQRHDHEQCQQNADEPFLHNFAPPNNYPSG